MSQSFSSFENFDMHANFNSQLITNPEILTAELTSSDNCLICGIGLRDWSDQNDSDHLPNQFPRLCNCMLSNFESIQDSTLQTLVRASALEANSQMARYPAYESLEKRKDSFTSAFPITGITPTDFAEAGFYSIGVQDYTRCFFCGVGLRGWDDTDDPWKQHAKFSGSCKYLIEKKGRAFVELHQNFYNEDRVDRPDRPDSDSTARASRASTNGQSKQEENSGKPRKLNENEIRLHVKARMEYPNIQLVLKYANKLGIAEDSVEKALEIRFRTYSDDFENLRDLVEAAYQLKVNN